VLTAFSIFLFALIAVAVLPLLLVAVLFLFAQFDLPIPARLVDAVRILLNVTWSVGAILNVVGGLALAAHFGDGQLRSGDLAAGLLGAVVKDPVQDRIVWLEYLEAVVKERDGWKDLYRACRAVSEWGRRRRRQRWWG
jgi:hypothetical protein